MENNKPKSEKFLRKRKALLVLPLLVLPFITLAFWALGGGKGKVSKEQAAPTGLNLSLPDAHLKEEKQQNKLSFYEKAMEDSVKKDRLLKNDPSYRKSFLTDDSLPSKYNDSSFFYDPAPPGLGVYKDSNEAKVYQKINELNRQLRNIPAPEEKQFNENTNHTRAIVDSINGGMDLDSLKNLMQMMEEERGGEDPEMKELNAMMDKILDIQHPERVKGKLPKTSQKQKDRVVPYTRKDKENTITLLRSPKQWDSLYSNERGRNGFYGLEESGITDPAPSNSIEAIVEETAVVTNGSTVKFRISGEVLIDGRVIPKNTFVYGTVTLKDERLQVAVTNIRYQSSIYPVTLSVYDLDGMEGIYVPGSRNSDAIKESADRTMDAVELRALDPSLKGQAAGAAAQAVKSAFRKKAKQVKVTLKAGYRVLLKDKEIR